MTAHSMNQAVIDRERGELVLSRLVDAPRERTFRAWTEPAQVQQWWGPKGFSTPYCTIDLRPGGVFHYCMRSPQGKDLWGKAVYREVVSPERIVYTDTFVDEQGQLVEPTYYGISPDYPMETLVTVTFDDFDDKTKVTMRQLVGALPEAELLGAQRGWGGMLDKLEALVQQSDR